MRLVQYAYGKEDEKWDKKDFRNDVLLENNIVQECGSDAELIQEFLYPYTVAGADDFILTELLQPNEKDRINKIISRRKSK